MYGHFSSFGTKWIPDKRKQCASVYATGIMVRNMDEARVRISKSQLFGRDEIEKTVRIIRSLISQKYIAKAQDAEAESRVDYLADILGLSKKEVVSIVERMRQEGILADSKDISAYLLDAVTRNENQRSSSNVLQNLKNTSLTVFLTKLYGYPASS